MKVTAAQKSALIWGVIGVGALVVVYVVYKALTDFNKGTPFEGTGAVGTLGNITNQVLGGAPQAVGESLSETLFNWTFGDDVSAALSDTLTFTFQSTGKAGAVNASDVARDGKFKYFRDGLMYQLKLNADGKRVAVKV